MSARPAHIPVPCLNGTSREELMEQRRLLLEALNGALRALQDAAPHGRDFQTGGSYPLAVEAHSRRYSALSEMVGEVYEELAAIQFRGHSIWCDYLHRTEATRECVCGRQKPV